MPGEGHASPYLAEFAPHERQAGLNPNSGHQQRLGRPMPPLRPILPPLQDCGAWCQRSTRSRGCLDLSTEKQR
jgi:hypothetical protein